MEQKIKDELVRLLNPKHVKVRPDSGMAYVEGWYVEAEANVIFEFEWDSEILSMIENTQPTKNKNDNYVVSFRSIVRVTAGGQFKDGQGYGSGISFDIHTAYEKAIKEAETDAEKRAFKKFGNRFGLALYDKTKAGVGVDEPVETPEQIKDRLILAINKTNSTSHLADLERVQAVKDARDKLHLDSPELSKKVDMAIVQKQTSFMDSTERPSNV